MRSLSCFALFGFLIFFFGFVSSSSLHRYNENMSDSEWMVVEKIMEGKGKEMKGPVDCEICKTFVSFFDDLLQKNASVTMIDELAFQICLQIDQEGLTPLVCHGTIREFGAEVIYVFTERFLTPTAVCDYLKLCHNSNLDESLYHTSYQLEDTTETQSWQEMMRNTLLSIQNDQKIPRKDSQKSQRNIGTFIQISDVHVDPRYLQGANALCPRPLCCRADGNLPRNQTEFRAAGEWGDYECDTPYRLLENLYDTFEKLPVKPDFMMYTGDNSPHDIWAQTQNMQQRRSVNFFENIQNRLPGWQVFPALGNHESFPVDQFSLPPSMDWLYDALATSWEPWLSESSLSTFRYAGYYTTLISPGLRLVSLNTMYCDTNNFWLLLDWQDPAGQIAWLNTTLAAAEKGNETVWIIGHIPFNSGGCLDSYAEPLWALVDQYSDTIANLFFGHTHRDSFFVMKDFKTNTEPIAIGYIAPSVTPYTNKNNAFRVYEYDRDSFEVLNYYQYILNLTEANTNGTPRWFIEYNPIDAYQMKSLSPAEWFKVANVTFNTDQNMLNLYQYYHGCSYGEITNCGSSCKNSTLCELQAATNYVSEECITEKEPSSGGGGFDLGSFINHFCPAWWTPS